MTYNRVAAYEVDAAELGKLIGITDWNCKFLIPSTVKELEELVKEGGADVVLAGAVALAVDEFALLTSLNQSPKSVPVIAVQEESNVYLTDRLVRRGVSEVLMKPLCPSLAKKRIQDVIEGAGLRDKVKTYEEERRGYLELVQLQAISVVARSVDARDDETGEHSIRVARYAVQVAKELNWDETRIKNLYYLGLLHDIGKVSVPDIIIRKPEKLSRSEWRVIREHTTRGAEILRDICMVQMAPEIALSHHEWYNGGGYPSGVSGNEIPLESRIIAIADAFDSMSRKHAYRSPLVVDDIITELEKGKGTQFDPALISIFVRLVREGKISPDETLPFMLLGDVENSETVETGGRLLARIMELNKSEAMKDPLTGLYNRGYAENMIMKHLQSERTGWFGMIDLDNFKHVNDHYGHQTGDCALRHVADLLYENVGDEGLVCRMGGDEFLVYFYPDLERERVQDWAERVLKQYERICYDKEYILGTSLSVGFAKAGADGADYEQLYAAADKALYSSKQNGKNRLSFYDEMLEPGARPAGDQIHHMANLIRDKRDSEGSYRVDYTEFQRIYNYIARSRKRTGMQSELILFTLMGDRDQKDYLLRLEEEMESLEQAVVSSLRTNDVCTRYSSFQILVVLTHISSKNTDMVIQRIADNYRRNHKNPNYTLIQEKMEIQDEVME